jgi:SNF2 family DNA or RNA helicase
MIHAGNIEGALAELGVDANTSMDIVEAATAEREKELDRLRKTLAFKQTIDYATPKAKEEALASLQSKILHIEAQLKTFKERLTSTSTEECPICYEDPKQNAATLTPCCSRIFCGGCILQSLTRGLTCPMCRTEIQTNQLVQIVEKEKAAKKKKKEEAPKLLSKQRQLIQFLKENPQARVLVFSRYENPFINLEADCDSGGITYHTLRGNKDAIAATIRAFEKGEKRVLFLPTQSAGAGLNLVTATHIIMLHAMTPEEEKQVIGRAYRLGRTLPLNVVRLLHQGETVQMS